MAPVLVKLPAWLPVPGGLRLDTDPVGLILAQEGLVWYGGVLLAALIFVALWKLRRHDRIKGWLFMLWLTLARTSRRSRRRETVFA